MAAHSSFMGFMYIFTIIPVGLNISINSYLGNLLGEGKVAIAKNFTKVSVTLNIFLALLTNIAGWGMRSWVL